MINSQFLTMKAFNKLKLPLGKLLDVGCRNEYLRKPLEDLGYEWHGCDIKPQSPNVKKCPMEALTYPDNSFDIIFCCHAFEHTERPSDTLREFKRVVKPEGTIFLSTPCPCTKQILEMDEDHINVLTREQLIRLLDYNGLRNVRIWVEENVNVETSSLITTIKFK